MTLQKTYTPTFLEKILGKYYKWWYTILFYFRTRIVSAGNNFAFVVGQIAILLVSLTVWWLANDKIIDLNLQETWTYFVIGELLYNFAFTFSEFQGFSILTGSVTRDLLRPQNFFLQTFAVYYGVAALQNIVKGILLFLILGAMILSKNISTFNFANFILALSLIPVAIWLRFFFGQLVAYTAFFLKNVDGVIQNYSYLLGVSMGRVFPLNLIIENFYAHLFNPFSFIFFHSMQIYLGNYTLQQTLLVFLGGILWCFVLYFLAKWVFKMGLKRNESVGL